MSITDAYKVVTTGQILDGFDPDDVREKLISALRLKPEQAVRFFEKPRVVKKDVSWASADKICSRLAKLGVSAKIQSPEAPAASQPAESEPVSREEPTLELVQDEAEASPTEGTIECPNCQHAQAKAEQCESCGVWFHKFEPPNSLAQPIAVPQAVPVAAAVATESENSTAVTSDAAPEEGTINPVAIAAAVVAALIGAWVWKFVAVTFEYEYGLIAWAIGGAIGFVAASAGSKGMQAGILCAILAFGSIFLGKYWAYSGFVDEFQTAIAGAMEVDDEMYAYFEEQMDDARAFARGSGSDIFIRRFMVERGYTYETDASRISPAEIVDFKEYVAPELRDMAQNPPNFEEWQASRVESLDEISPWVMMQESFGLLDILFIFLGVGTAFRLASQQE